MTQDHAVSRRDDGGLTEVEASRIACSGCHGCLRTQVLQRLQTDHLIRMQTFATLQVASGFIGYLLGLLELRVDFGELELREKLTLFDGLPLLHGDPTDDAARLER